jgi:hypothetical protein
VPISRVGLRTRHGRERLPGETLPDQPG